MTSAKETPPTVRSPIEKQLDLVVTQAGHRKGRAALMVSNGEAAGTVFPITEPSVLIGRSLDAQVCINEQAISYEHARLEQTASKFTLRDLGSTNGTYVNGERITDVVVLAGGDSIRMGSTTFTFVTQPAGAPKGTVKLNDPNPDLPVAPQRRRGPEPHAVSSVSSVAMAPASESQHTDSISLTDVVRTVKTYWVYARRYGWIVATCMCFGIAAGIVQVWLRPPPGTAWFEMTLTAGGRDADEESPQFFVGPESTFRSLPLIKKTLSELGVANVSDATASDVQSALSFERVGYTNSRVYRGEYEDATAEIAVTFLKKHVDVYIESELDKVLKVLRTDATFDREQVEQADQRVAEARNRLIEFSDEHPEAVPKDAKLPDQPRLRLAPGASPERIRQSIASTERALRAAYASIQSKKARPYLEQVAAAETKIAEARARGLRDQHPEIRGLMALQSTMRSKANALMAAEPSLSEKSLDPKVAQLEEDLKELRGRLAQVPGSAPSTPAATAGVAVAPAGPTLAGTPAALTPSTVKIAPIPASAFTEVPSFDVAAGESLSQLKIYYGELAREYERAKTEHEALMKKRETTERQLERERTSAEARYGIITPPTPAKKSTSKAMMKRGGLGGMVGLGLAMIAAACLELRRILIARGHL
jgi:pSer/pThr/pTyr-binding forkhead associated (FHA) protein